MEVNKFISSIKENKIIVIIIFIIFFIFVVIYIFNINKKSSSNKHHITEDKNNHQNLSNLGENENISLSDLFQRCPCGENYFCDKGICKLKQGERCITNSSCSSDSFCFNEICAIKPKNIDELFFITKKYFELNPNEIENFENKYSAVKHDNVNVDILTKISNICTDKNLMLLKDDKFTLNSGWWSLVDTINVCESNNNEIFYVLNSKGNIFSISLNEINIEKIISNSKKIFSKLVNINNRIYGLTYDRELYLLQNEKSKTWIWKLVEDFFGQNILNKEIDDIISVNNFVGIKIGNIFLFAIDLNKPENWDKLILDEVEQINVGIYGNNIYFMIIGVNNIKIKILNRSRKIDDPILLINEYNKNSKNKNFIEDIDEFEIYDNNDKLEVTLEFLFNLEGKQGEFDPNRELSFYIIDVNNEIINIIIKDNQTVTNKISGAYADKIYKTRKNLWITTLHQCVKI